MEPTALDAVPESLEAAQDEHAAIMQQIAQAQQIIETGTRRGIFLEGYIASLMQPKPAKPAPTKRTNAPHARRR